MRRRPGLGLLFLDPLGVATQHIEAPLHALDADRGQVRCPDCADWTDDATPERQGRRCDECYDLFLQDQEAERKGDAAREEN